MLVLSIGDGRIFLFKWDRNRPCVGCTCISFHDMFQIQIFCQQQRKGVGNEGECIFQENGFYPHGNGFNGKSGSGFGYKSSR